MKKGRENDNAIQHSDNNEKMNLTINRRQSIRCSSS